MRDEFKKAVGDVTPLRQSRRVDLRGPAPSPEARQRRLDELATLAESLDGPLDELETGDPLSFLREGLARETLRKLRRGHWTIQDGLDLHGLTREEAATAVVEFLDHCLSHGLRCVRIVHGKGLGILRAKLGKWLPRRDEILAFCQAPAREGGAGALLVLLKSGTRRQTR